MQTIVEEEEKDSIPPLDWWTSTANKRGGQAEEQVVVIPLGEKPPNRRHSLNLPSSPVTPASPTRLAPPTNSSLFAARKKQALGINLNALSLSTDALSPRSPSSNTLTPQSPRSTSFPNKLKDVTTGNASTNPSASTTSPTSPTHALSPRTPRNISAIAGESKSNLKNDTTNAVDSNGTDESGEGKPIIRTRSLPKTKSSSVGDFAPILPRTTFLREMAVREILESETAYVKDLAVLMQEFYIPMKTREILPKPILDEIFLNIEAIVNLHIELESELREDANIAGTFQKMTPYLRVYTKYCANGTKALETLIKYKKNPNVEKFLAHCLANESLKGMPLESYLIKPTQRLCKYPLLFQAVLSNTASGTKEYKELEEVLEQIKDVVTVVNEEKRQIESLQKMEEFKAQIKGNMEELFAKTKIFIKEGELAMAQEPSVELTFSLFDDLLLVTKPKGKKNKRKLLHAFGLDRMLIKDVVKLDESVPKTTFEVWTFENDKKLNVRLIASNEREKKNWIAALDKATTAKAANLFEVFRQLTQETNEPSSDSSFDSWYLNRKIRLFGDYVVKKSDEQIQQLRVIRQVMQEDHEAEQLRHAQEDAERNILKLRAVVKSYNTEQMKRIAYLQQLEGKLAKLEYDSQISQGIILLEKGK